MKDCIILQFQTHYGYRTIEKIGDYPDFEMSDYPGIQERINRYLSAGYEIKGYTNHGIGFFTFCLVKDN